MDKKESFKITTPSGKTFEYVNAYGTYMPIVFDKYIEEFMPKLPDMKAREDDVIVCGFLRSGTNWTWEIVNMLINDKAEYQKDRKWPTLLEGNTQKSFDKMPSPRILSSHLNFKLFPRDFIKQKCKIAYVQRNPKDVAVSFFNYSNDELETFDLGFTWEDTLDMFVNGREDTYYSWHGTTKSWEKAMDEYPGQILLVYYEELKKNTVEEITRIARFLKVRHDGDFINDITDRTGFTKMRKAKLQYFSEALQNNQEMNEFGNTLEKREKYYRKGEVGDWKNHFTVAQNEYWDDIMTKRWNLQNIIRVLYAELTVKYVHHNPVVDIL